MKRGAAAACFAVGWLACLVALTPMRWLGELDLWRQAGISAAGATGTVWNGRLLGVESGSRPWGDLRAGLSPLALFGGTAAIAFVSPERRGELRFGRERGLRDASGEWSLALRTDQGPARIALSLESFTAVFRAGRCVEAQGSVHAVVTLPAAGAPTPRLVLSGEPTCREGVVEASLLPAPGAPAVELLVQAKDDGDYRLTWMARSPDAALGTALALAGFTASPEGMARVDEGGLSRPGAAQE